MQNLLSVVEVETANNFGGIAYLGFEKLTFVPIQVQFLSSRLSLLALIILKIATGCLLFPGRSKKESSLSLRFIV